MFKKFLLFVVLLFVSTACGSSEPSGPDSLAGTWSTTSTDGPTMTADVSADTIEIQWTTADTTALYWKGSFESSATNGSTITSDGDTETMAMSLLASMSETKEFVYDDGKISFDFTIMGVTSKLTLERD